MDLVCCCSGDFFFNDDDDGDDDDDDEGLDLSSCLSSSLGRGSSSLGGRGGGVLSTNVELGIGGRSSSSFSTSFKGTGGGVLSFSTCLTTLLGVVPPIFAHIFASTLFALLRNASFDDFTVDGGGESIPSQIAS